MSLGTLVKELRKTKGWTQGQLALYSGLTKGYISRIEIDSYKSPGSKAIVQLAKALDVSENDLFVAAGIKSSNSQSQMESPYTLNISPLLTQSDFQLLQDMHDKLESWRKLEKKTRF
jgi:transcriptional regulator with XRE-family HTH domain